MVTHLRLNDVPTKRLDPREGAFLILAHKRGEACYVSRENRCEAPLHLLTAWTGHLILRDTGVEEQWCFAQHASSRGINAAALRVRRPSSWMCHDPQPPLSEFAAGKPTVQKPRVWFMPEEDIPNLERIRIFGVMRERVPLRKLRPSPNDGSAMRAKATADIAASHLSSQRTRPAP